MKVQNDAYVRDQFKVNGSPVGFNIRENNESTDIVTASTL